MLDRELNTGTIKALLQNAVTHKDRCGFAAYIVAKNDPKLREMILDEKTVSDTNYKNIVRDVILDVIGGKFLSDQAQYMPAQNVADDQNKFYIIKQEGEYKPFDYLKTSLETVPEFKHNMVDDASGIAFWFRIDNNEFWAYQHLWSIMVPNKKRTNLLSRIQEHGDHDYFAEQVDPLLTIANKVDALVIDDNIITSNISLMQTSFGFQDFIVATANKSVDRITDKNLVSNPQKLFEYIGRGKTSKYAKKMMRIVGSKVLDLTKDQLMEKVHTLPRWNGKFDENEGQIVLNTYTQVESLIDLLDERYTRSDVTDQEYDTDVKQVAAPISASE